MPKENNKRGRRAEEKKRKLEAEEPVQAPKRQKAEQTQGFQDANHSSAPQQDEEDFSPLDQGTWLGEIPFFGMLDEEEQKYFKTADEVLELNQFSGPEERNLFLANVYRETEGKELKLVISQSCSRLMERLILLSTPAQLKALFHKFTANFLYLTQHRFASHCCEALFLQSALVVTQDHLAPVDIQSTSGGAVHSGHTKSMEDLFLTVVTEIEDNLGYLMTERFASHTLRVLLLVLSGRPIDVSSTKSLLKSRRKEHVTVSGHNHEDGLSSKESTVPDSFTEALRSSIMKCTSGLDTNFLRTLATHPTGNPTLQLLLQIELSRFGKQRARDEDSIIRKLLPDDSLAEGTESAAFIQSLLYDSVGSRLLETVIEYAPGKMFKAIYKEFFKDRIGDLVRHETAGYVSCKVLERLSKEDLEDATKAIAPQFQHLVDKGRTNVIKVLAERCAARGADIDVIAKELEKVFIRNPGFSISHLLSADPSSLKNELAPAQQVPPNRLHASLLVQAMVPMPGALSTIVFDALLKLDTSALLVLAKDQTGSHALQAAMVSHEASIIFRRKIIQQFYGHMGELAVHPSGSHVVDKIWEATHGLAFIRERVAEELAENEASLRESVVGRAVWRNWRMDLYKRRRSEWVKQSKKKAGNDGFQSFPDLDTKRANEEGKTKLELARAKHAAGKTGRGKEVQRGHATSASTGARIRSATKQG